MATLKGVVHISDASQNVKATHIDTKLEVIVIPVSDVDKAKEFYAGQADTNWTDWYAEYMVREQKGEALQQ